MSIFVVDVEADGPAPGLYSMIALGAVRLGAHDDLGHGFHALMRPLPGADWKPDALVVSGYSRIEVMGFPLPAQGMMDFAAWIDEENSGGRPTFVADNPAFDWQFVNYYFWMFLNYNPFGFSARRIGDFAAGLRKNFHARQDWKKLRKTRHTHNPLDDARGNAEALATLIAKCRG